MYVMAVYRMRSWYYYSFLVSVAYQLFRQKPICNFSDPYVHPGEERTYQLEYN